MNTVLRGTISLHWLLPPCIGAVLVIGLAGCSLGDPPPNLSNASTDVRSSAMSGGSTAQPSSTASRSRAVPSSSATSSGAASTSAPVVPVDQIPPGNPERWVPAGVPTTAPYKEAGDVAPMFTRDMFVNSQAGALATARYYLDARNWAYATMNAQPFLVVCTSPGCRIDSKFYSESSAKDLHLVGGRRRTASVASRAKDPSAAEALTIRAHVKVDRGSLVNASNRVIRQQKPSSQVIDLLLDWEGGRWHVADELVVV
jgi:hypothetical protein